MQQFSLSESVIFVFSGRKKEKVSGAKYSATKLSDSKF
jgi:hypothetical protein